MTMGDRIKPGKSATKGPAQRPAGDSHGEASAVTNPPTSHPAVRRKFTGHPPKQDD